jgi:hypothetical protein
VVTTEYNPGLRYQNTSRSATWSRTRTAEHSGLRMLPRFRSGGHWPRIGIVVGRAVGALHRVEFRLDITGARYSTARANGTSRPAW